mgnify:CR=1 FL=1
MAEAAQDESFMASTMAQSDSELGGLNAGLRLMRMAATTKSLLPIRCRALPVVCTRRHVNMS